jgi:hypothetical protein
MARVPGGSVILTLTNAKFATFPRSLVVAILALDVHSKIATRGDRGLSVLDPAKAEKIQVNYLISRLS